MDIYQEEILEQYRHPHNSGTLPDADVVQQEENPLCGDRLTFSLKFSDGRVEAIQFTGEGCAISQASASMLTDEVKGKSINEVKRYSTEDILNMLAIQLGPTRLKCALLSLQGIKRAIDAYEHRGSLR